MSRRVEHSPARPRSRRLSGALGAAVAAAVLAAAVLAVAVLAVAVLAAAVPASAAVAGGAPASAGWRTETLSPAGVIAPAALAFDARGDGLLAWSGNPYARQPPLAFTGAEVREGSGPWRQAADLPLAAIEQLWLYGSRRATVVGSEAVIAPSGAPRPGTPPCCVGSGGRVERVRVIYANGSAAGSFGAVKVLDEDGSAPVSAADQRGDALVAWVHAARLRLVERHAGGAFGAPVTFAGRALAGDPVAVALSGRGERVLAWVEGGNLYAHVRSAGQPWGASLLVARLPAPPRPVPVVKLRAAVSPSGTVVLAWETATGCEGCATVLRAGAARLTPGGRWRTFTLESASISSKAPGGAVGDGLAAVAPLVDSYGRVYLVWTGGLQHAPIVKLAELTASGVGYWTALSDSSLGAALDDAAAGPGGALLVSWFDESHSTSGVGPVYASLRRGSNRFALAVRLTGEQVTGGSGLVAFQPSSGEALVVAGVVAGAATLLQVATDDAPH